MKLEQMEYKSFGKLKYLDWFSKGKDYYIDDVEGYETRVGLTLEEGGVGSMLFMSRRGQTVMISLDFTYASASVLNQAYLFLDNLGLPLRKGMSLKRIEGIFGKPSGLQYGLPAWVAGQAFPYYIICTIEPKCGLYRVEICRKDLADKEAKRA